MTTLLAAKTANIGFPVKRLLPRGKYQRVGPFIFFDHMGPAVFETGTTRGDVRPHPHIGLATVTYLFSGALIHHDSLDIRQRIEPGAVNLMVAGRGIAHSERIPPDIREQQLPVEGIQVWLAMPTELEESAPEFTHYAAADLPAWSDEHCTIQILLGEIFGRQSPVRTPSPALWLDIQIVPHGHCDLPGSRQQRAIYLASGAATVNGTALPTHHLLLLDTEHPIDIKTGAEPARLMLIGGDPLAGERFINWNFVSSDRERIERARTEWQARQFPQVPGEADALPLPL